MHILNVTSFLVLWFHCLNSSVSLTDLRHVNTEDPPKSKEVGADGSEKRLWCFTFSKRTTITLIKALKAD